jgi:hypothetical protein
MAAEKRRRGREPSGSNQPPMLKIMWANSTTDVVFALFDGDEHPRVFRDAEFALRGDLGLNLVTQRGDELVSRPMRRHVVADHVARGIDIGQHRPGLWEHECGFDAMFGDAKVWVKMGLSAFQ